MGLKYANLYWPGDLVYGIAKERNALVNFFERGGGEHPYFCADHLLFSASNDAEPNNFQQVDIGYGVIGSQYLEPRFVKFLSNHPKYSCIRQYDPAKATNSKQGITLHHAMLRRKCKAALEWVVFHTEHHIHFNLSGIDLVAVAKKNFADEFPLGKAPLTTSLENKDRMITGAELRWIYRHKNDRRVAARAQFWDEESSGSGRFFPCKPPWETSFLREVRRAWIEYGTGVANFRWSNGAPSSMPSQPTHPLLQPQRLPLEAMLVPAAQPDVRYVSPQYLPISAR